MARSAQACQAVAPLPLSKEELQKFRSRAHRGDVNPGHPQRLVHSHLVREGLQWAKARDHSTQVQDSEGGGGREIKAKVTDSKYGWRWRQKKKVDKRGCVSEIASARRQGHILGCLCHCAEQVAAGLAGLPTSLQGPGSGRRMLRVRSSGEDLACPPAPTAGIPASTGDTLTPPITCQAAFGPLPPTRPHLDHDSTCPSVSGLQASTLDPHAEEGCS